MAPNIYQQSLKARGFTLTGNGGWHGPWGLTIPGTWNDITTTSLADSARSEIIAQIDRAIEVKRRDYNAK